MDALDDYLKNNKNISAEMVMYVSQPEFRLKKIKKSENPSILTSERSFFSDF